MARIMAAALVCCLTVGNPAAVSAEETDYFEIPEEDTIVSEEAEAEEELEQAAAPSVSYRTHVQGNGWQDAVRDGAMSGTSGQSRRLEAIEINVSGDEALGIRYMTHIQTYGWESAWKENGAMSGTSGQSKRLEAIRIELTGADAAEYDVYYCVHAQHFGWLNWAKNGEEAGTAGYSYRLEGIKIRILPRGSGAPANEGGLGAAFYSDSDGPAPGSSVAGIIYNTHVQTYGWQEHVSNGAMSGTAGQSKRLEGIHIFLSGQKYGGGIEYRTHVQTYGWQDWKKDGQMSGTSGQSKRLEAIQIRLTGEMAEKYDVFYRVHAQRIGWMAWAKNGEMAGTAGYSYRLEAIQIVLTDKGAGAPPADLGGYRQTAAEAFSQNTQKTFPSLVSLGIPYGDTVNNKVDGELREMYREAKARGIDIDSLSDIDKAFAVTSYIGSHFVYLDGSHTAESMIDSRGGTCYGYADLTNCFARKIGLQNTWITIPGRNIDHDNKTYGSLHRTAVALIGGKYYDLDSNMYSILQDTVNNLEAMGYEVGPVDFRPEQISKAYADYLIGNTNVRPAKIP